MNTTKRKRKLHSLLLVISALGVCQMSHAAFAQTQTGSASSGSKQAPSDPFRVAGMAQAAVDIRIAGESFERFGKSLEKSVGSLSKGLTESTRNLAGITDGIDPLGLKEAFRTVQQQNETIRELHEAESKRLRKENKRLRKELKLLKKKRKSRR